MNKSRDIAKANPPPPPPPYGQVVGETNNKYYIHIGQEPIKDPENDVQNSRK